MKKLTVLLAGAALMVGMSVIGASNAQANLIVNGSFESPSISGDWQGYGYSTPDSTGIPGWTVYNVDIVKNSYYPAANGNQSLDLNGTDSGWIYQQFNTISGQNYRLTFDLAGNPLGGGPSVKVVDFLAGSIAGSVSFETIGHSPTNMGWETLSYDFTANGTDQFLLFASTSSGTGGPALDNISIDAVPEPGTMMLLGFGMLGLAVYGKRRMNNKEA